ncbi:MAG: divalent metal cation transporter [Calditrichia bacterium]|jgi:Mn2+/Fe2+ NRAMP family transporter|nr:divalent metal cation transporter [Calditrichia bacterium]
MNKQDSAKDILNSIQDKSDIENLRRGLSMVEKYDAEALEKEKKQLIILNNEPSLLLKWKGYWKLSGPAWMQSAVTLGAGSAASSIFAGSVFGYKLLWVQPVSIILGIVIFAAIGSQVLRTRARPYDVFWKKLHPSLAIFWGFNVLLASIVWQFPQYSLGTAVVRDILDVFGFGVPKWITAVLFLIVVTSICWTYGRGKRRSMIVFERTLKYLVFVVIFAFLGVVIKTGIDWGELVSGYFGFYLPTDVKGITIVLGAIGAAVGVNMTFLYPYSMLARGWGKEHLGLKNFDLMTSMFIPFILATTLVIIASANTLYVRGAEVRNVIDAAHILEPIIGLTLSRIVFSTGILSMCLTTAVLEMLIGGFVLSEMFNFEFKGRAFKVSTMVANIGFLGAFYGMPIWLPVLTSSFNLVMLPIAYVCFFLLQNREDYMGNSICKGRQGYLWNIGMLLAIFIVSMGAWIKLFSVVGLIPE